MNNSTLIKPYGDTLNDGKIQLSFTLPVENGARAKKAAEEYLLKLNMQNIQVIFQESLTSGFTFFVAYAEGKPTIDFNEINASEIQVKIMDFYEINNLIKTKLNRKLNVIGATIGSDAHTVGIDAIMNMKGYNMDYGLERYPEIEAINLGAQVPCETLLKESIKQNVDAILVSQTVTQKDSHINNFTEFIELLEVENIRSKFIVLAGGPRISNDLAIELGYDAGFGSGTIPSTVASFIVTKLIDLKES